MSRSASSASRTGEPKSGCRHGDDRALGWKSCFWATNTVVPRLNGDVVPGPEGDAPPGLKGDAALGRKRATQC